MLHNSAVEVQNNLVSRNVKVDGRRTSIRLEAEIWGALLDVCARESKSIDEICTILNRHGKSGGTLTARLRVFVFSYFRAAATDDGHDLAGHGNMFDAGQPVFWKRNIKLITVPARIGDRSDGSEHLNPAIAATASCVEKK
ncbi:MAG: ribbon-helix-helix domain-containing protein [Pseudomonadota bacterium]|nr:ribbon-helix-helix domain-containing protein [Pseudomonadota bacterium]